MFKQKKAQADQRLSDFSESKTDYSGGGIWKDKETPPKEMHSLKGRN